MNQVRGALFVDYVRMLRGAKTVDWGAHLQPEDLPHLENRIDPDAWYPMGAFERMGLAIFKVMADGSLDRVRDFGRASVDWLKVTYPRLVMEGDPMESLMRFQVLRKSFFNYEAVTVPHLSQGEARVVLQYRMSPAAEEAACHQTLGFFERLLEVAGARNADARFTEHSWAGAEVTTIVLEWE